MNFMLCLSLLAPLRTAIPIKEPFPTPEQIWAVGAAILGLWIFAVGASVGSFINVVVYRLPLGLSLSSPGSRCPRCLHPIRLQHNVPILGWLLLRGRCADCQLPISGRYPLVELLVGSAFLLVGGVELLGNGMNLPRPSPEFLRAVLNTFEPQALGVAVMVHLALVATLICAALIDFDGHAVPKRLALPVIFLTVVVSLVWPAVHPIAAVEMRVADLPAGVSRWLHSPVVDLVAGGIAGLLAAGSVQLAIGSRWWLTQRYGGTLVLLWIAIGMILGWQMIPFALAGWAVLQVRGPQRDLTRSPLRPFRDLALVFVVTLLGWRVFAAYPRIINPAVVGQLLTYTAAVVAAGFALLAAARSLPAEYEFPRPVTDEAFLPTPEPMPEPATQTSEPAGDDSPLSSNESNEHE